MIEQLLQFGGEKGTAIRTTIFRKTTAIFRNSMQFLKSSTIPFFGSPKCHVYRKIIVNYRKIAENYRKIAVNYRKIAVNYRKLQSIIGIAFILNEPCL